MTMIACFTGVQQKGWRGGVQGVNSKYMGDCKAVPTARHSHPLLPASASDRRTEIEITMSDDDDIPCVS